MLWRIDLELGKLFRRQRRYDDAQRSFLSAQQIVDELAARIPDSSTRERFVQQVATRFPQERTLSTRREVKQKYDGLTQREREIATLIAEGKSNREIADALVLSPVTVATHISNIFSKLGFHSRAQIAAWAVEKGLVKYSEPG